MARRVYGGAMRRTHDVSISDAQFQAIEAACGVSFDENQRQQIDDAVDFYLILQSNDWNSPRASRFRDPLKKLHQSLSALDSSLAPLREGDLSSVLWHQLGLSAHLKLRGMTDDTDGWLADTLQRIEQLRVMVADVKFRLPEKDSGRNDDKSQFGILVTGLAETFASAGQVPSVTYDNTIGGYRDEGFYSLVHRVQLLLPIEFQYLGTSLGKMVSRHLADIKGSLGTALTMTNNVSLQKALAGP